MKKPIKSELFLKISAISLIFIGLGFVLWIGIVSLHEPSEVKKERTDQVDRVKQIAEESVRGVPEFQEIKSEEQSDSTREKEDSESDLTQEYTQENEVDEEDKRVDEFDKLTDKWMEPSKKAISQDDISKFVMSFKRVPESRRDECIHRALNLIPDDNIMLLAGIMFDKSLGKETVEVVFNDILNRDETMKKTILKQIFKDKSHPCWTDVAWILDVTGELPGTEGK